jgi:hypothetical protein
LVTVKPEEYEAMKRKFGPPEPTPEAWALSGVLSQLGWENRLEELFVSYGQMFYADIWIPAVWVIVEVDGLYHETDPVRRALDAGRSSLFREMDILVKRVRNREVNADVLKVALSVIEFCNRRPYMTWRG